MSSICVFHAAKRECLLNDEEAWSLSDLTTKHTSPNTPSLWFNGQKLFYLGIYLLRQNNLIDRLNQVVLEVKILLGNVLFEVLHRAFGSIRL